MQEADQLERYTCRAFGTRRDEAVLFELPRRHARRSCTERAWHPLIRSCAPHSPVVSTTLACVHLFSPCLYVSLSESIHVTSSCYNFKHIFEFLALTASASFQTPRRLLVLEKFPFCRRKVPTPIFHPARYLCDPPPTFSL